MMEDVSSRTHGPAHLLNREGTSTATASEFTNLTGGRSGIMMPRGAEGKMEEEVYRKTRRGRRS